jgi:hypothetical protein
MYSANDMAEPVQSERSAYDALRDVPKPDALAELTREALSLRLDESATRAKAKALELGDDDGKTPFGDAVAVLARGPEDDAERALARSLGAHAVASSKGDVDPTFVVRLAGKTAFDPSTLLDEALGDRADALLGALASRVTADASEHRDEALVACAVLLASKRPRARKEVAGLVKAVSDPLVRAVLERGERAPETLLAGELVPAPRNPVLTVLLGVTGILFVAAGARILARLVLAYRCPAELTASSTGVRIKTRTELLGRTLRDRQIVIGSDALVRAVREVRFPRLGLYAGLLALALGTWVGVSALVDSARAASPTLLLWGLGFVAAGIALDLVLSSVRFGAQGKCRVVLAPRKGRVVCIGYVDPKRADAALAALAQR